MTGLPIGRRDLLVIGVVVAIATAISCFPYLPEWYGSWGEAAAALEVATTLTYPFVAGGAAWLGSAPRRQRFLPLLVTSARSRTNIYARAAVGIGGAALLGSLAIAVVVWGITASEATFGSLPLLSPLVIGSGFWAVASLGLWGGTLMPPLVAPVASLAAVYAAETLADTSRPGLSPLAGLVVADFRERTYLVTADWVLLNRSLWLIAVGALFLALAPRRRSAWLLPFAAVCFLAAPLLLVGDTGMQVDQAAMKPVCKDYSPAVTVCLTAARNHVSPEVARAARPELELLSGLGPGGIQLAENDIAGGPSARFEGSTLVVPFGVTNGLSGDAHQVNAQDLQVELAAVVFTSNCGADSLEMGADRPLATGTQVILLWLFRQLDIPTDGSAGFGSPPMDETIFDYSAVATFKQQWDSANQTERTAWLSRNRQAVIDCDVPATVSMSR